MAGKKNASDEFEMLREGGTGAPMVADRSDGAAARQSVKSDTWSRHVRRAAVPSDAFMPESPAPRQKRVPPERLIGRRIMTEGLFMLVMVAGAFLLGHAAGGSLTTNWFTDGGWSLGEYFVAMSFLAVALGVTSLYRWRSMHRELERHRRARDRLRKRQEELEKNLTDSTTELQMLSLRLEDEAIERSRAEEALNESRKNLQILFDAIDDLLFVFDKEGVIRSVNPVVSGRLGVRPEELVGVSLTDWLAEDAGSGKPGNVKDLFTPHAGQCKLKLRTRSDGPLSVDMRVLPGKWEGQSVFFGFCREADSRVKLGYAGAGSKVARESGDNDGGEGDTGTE